MGYPNRQGGIFDTGNKFISKRQSPPFFNAP